MNPIFSNPLAKIMEVPGKDEPFMNDYAIASVMTFKVYMGEIEAIKWTFRMATISCADTALVSDLMSRTTKLDEAAIRQLQTLVADAITSEAHRIEQEG